MMRFRFQRDRNVGWLLLAVWLIVIGLQAFVPLGGLGQLSGALAIAAGVFILLGK